MKYIAILLIVLLTATIFLIGCTTKAYVEIDGELIEVEIVDTPLERKEGLMHRESLCISCGMLFIMDKEAKHSFWMKNTLIPLDMVFINSDLVIVDVLHAEPCKEDPCVHYTPKEDALYVLETNVMKFDESLIGKKVKITKN
ncbi:DUF192 domain-containing protein [Candidatus Woesearchaeota archaeon]|nr:DUF192 domain-containing protein [Candidatus Woesearchaeota archaeon]